MNITNPIIYDNIVEISLNYDDIKKIIKKLNNELLLNGTLSTNNEQIKFMLVMM